MLARCRRASRGDTGASAVEFALVVPLLLLLVFGIINFGAIFGQQLALNNGVRQGTRLAVVAGNPGNQTCGQVLTAIQSASGPAIAMTTSSVRVQAQRVLSTNTSSVQLTCFSSGGVTTPSGSNVDTRVCEDSTNTDNSIKATASYPAKFLIPLPFLPSTIDLQATAVYRCEFNS